MLFPVVNVSCATANTFHASAVAFCAISAFNPYPWSYRTLITDPLVYVKYEMLFAGFPSVAFVVAVFVEEFLIFQII